jgi:uncharacterized protein YbcI
MTEQLGPLSGQISRDTVQILRKYSGRGPTKAKTAIGGDVVTVVVADALTPAEQTVAEGGEAEVVLAQRHALQRAMRNELTAMVERHTKRKVIAFMSDNHIDPDYGAEVFVLEPERA